MATNFEFYKDEILKITATDSAIAVVDNNPVECGATKCQNCDLFGGIVGVHCRGMFIKWLYAEHIEQPKLTKRERAFCEAVQTGWIARDKSGVLTWTHKDTVIKKEKDYWHYSGGNWILLAIMDLKFDFVKWEDEKPWAVSELLKLEVMEE